MQEISNKLIDDSGREKNLWIDGGTRRRHHRNQNDARLWLCCFKSLPGKIAALRCWLFDCTAGLFKCSTFCLKANFIMTLIFSHRGENINRDGFRILITFDEWNEMSPKLSIFSSKSFNYGTKLEQNCVLTNLMN